MWVLFRDDGVVRGFSGLPLDGGEWVEGAAEANLIGKCRVSGHWSDAPPEPEAVAEPVPEPEPEPVDIKAELAALADRVAELQAMVEAAP
jgi:hypothetical protein